jgi:hypothetical protein
MDISVSEPSDKQRLEGDDQVVDVINCLNKQWEDRFTLNNARLVENYLEGKAHFLILIETIAEAKNQFIALVERALPIGRIGDELEVKRLAEIDDGRHINTAIFQEVSESAPEKSRRGETSNSRADCYQEAMLVDIVKLVKFPEQIVPSLVRFGSVDSIYRRLRHALYFSFTRGFVFRGTIRVDYRETDLLLFGSAQDNALLGAPDLHEMPSEMVKGASCLLEDFSRDERDSPDNRLSTSEVMMRCVRKFSVWLDANLIRLAIEKGLDPRFQFLDVMVGPCDLHTDQPNSFISGHS